MKELKMQGAPDYNQKDQTQAEPHQQPLARFEGAIFDLDGTLIDTNKLWDQIDRDFLKNRGLTATIEYTQAVRPLSLTEAAAYTIKTFGLAEPVGEIVAQWTQMAQKAYARGVALKANAKAYLHQLKAAGIKIGVATGMARSLCEPTLASIGVFHLFDAFAFTEETAKGKDFADVYLLAATRLGVLPACCMVFEDSLNGIRSSKKAGMQTCGIYDEGPAQNSTALKREADFFLYNFHQAPLPIK